MFALLIFFLVPSMAAGKQTASLVWSDSKSGHEQIYFSRYTDGTWENPTQLTDSEHLDYFPSSSMAKDGTTWVVWSSVQGKNILLMYSVLTDGSWSQPAAIDTGMTTNTGVSLILDGNGTPLIAWAGFDGQDDEIFWSHWESGGWAAAERVAADNDVPDILPKLALDNHGVLTIHYQSYNGNSYETKSFSHIDGHWQETAVQPLRKTRAASAQAERRVRPQLPAFVPDPSKAKIHIPSAR